MEALFGIKGKDFVLMATDTRSIRSIVVMQSEQEKFRSLNSKTLLAYSGEPGDSVNFAEFIQRNTHLYSVKNERDLGVSASANWTRKVLADSLRSRSPYQVNVLVGGVEDEDEGGEGVKLYWIDYLAAMVELPFAVHGYAAYFCTSLLDRHWKPELSESEAVCLLKLCLEELKKRFVVNFPQLAVKIVRKAGIEDINL